MPPLYDDMGTPLNLARPPRRVVSLVPSLTEAIAAGRRDVLVGATQWCTHPGDLDVVRVRGTKNPDRDAIIGLRPDLVIANKEENRELDVTRLRDAGVPVWVTVIETVPQALDSLQRLFIEALETSIPDWLRVARALWSGPLPDVAATTAVPVWRDPWIVVGRSTFTGDLLRRAGLANAFAGHRDRYPHVALEEIDRPDVDVVLLPDEPYVFTESDGPEAFNRVPNRLVNGRLITWYGPSLVTAHDALRQLVATL
ncbi:helical backbone metal receptor [Streptomyces sp. RB6PN25]|uniref:Helical backbone metal receptor n=1 Tax=Streptomyces humicola TaxID=2953240 RepID=A0ABT1PNC5_9ACTN|nr:helical backbone metal receptor [Streptomyces humicola]MCQ4079186.1 helical backbone metal receptor [Streptomyces humicola]